MFFILQFVSKAFISGTFTWLSTFSSYSGILPGPAKSSGQVGTAGAAHLLTGSDEIFGISAGSWHLLPYYSGKNVLSYSHSLYVNTVFVDPYIYS